MGLEIELKVWIDDPDAVRSDLVLAGRPGRSYTKRDRYFGLDSSRDKTTTLFRLRADGNRWLVTRKNRIVEHGIEVNREIEYGVDDPDSFTAFCESLGYSIVVSKVKRVEQFRLPGDGTVPSVLAELCVVEGLGNFLELEILLPGESGAAAVQAAKSHLRSILRRMKIDESRMEPRRYTEMLMEHR